MDDHLLSAGILICSQTARHSIADPAPGKTKIPKGFFTDINTKNQSNAQPNHAFKVHYEIFNEL